VRACEHSNAPTSLLYDELGHLPPPTGPDPEARLVTVGEAEVSGLDLTLPRGIASFAGRVAGGNGAALAGARVVVRPHDSHAWRVRLSDQERVFEVLAGPGGAFRIDGLPPGSVSVSAEYPGLPPLHVGATAGDQTVVLRFKGPAPGR